MQVVHVLPPGAENGIITIHMSCIDAFAETQAPKRKIFQEKQPMHMPIL